MEQSRGSAKAIKEIVNLGSRISVEEMYNISEISKSSGGSLVAVEPEDDDWCGTGILRFKWPIPKPDSFVALLEKLAAERINFEVLINGIPVPDHIMMRLSRRIGRH